MPYSGPNDPDLPEHVQAMPEDKRRQWIAVFEQVLADTGDEGEAMAAANAAVSEKTHTTTVKALTGEGRVGGYLVLWGDASRKDLEGEYFTPDTDLALDWYATRPTLYHHGLDTGAKSALIGVIDTMKADDTGLWVEAQLNMRDKWARAVQDLVEKAALGWSSGSLPHLVEVERDGKIVRWPIVEGSLTPTPAEPRQPSVSPVKHYADTGFIKQAFKSVGIDDDADLLKLDAANEGAAVTEQADEVAGQDATSKPSDEVIPDTEGSEMPNNTPAAEGTDIEALVAEQVQAYIQQQKEETRQAELEAKAARADELEARIAELEAKSAPERQPAKRLPGSELEPEDRDDPKAGQKHPVKITVGSKYDGLSALDMAHGLIMAKSVRDETSAFKTMITEQYAKAFAEKLAREGYQPIGAKGVAMKTDELVHSTQSGYGDEWVPDLWSGELWRRARVENVILPQFRTIDMPSNPFNIPAQGADPTVYYVGETTDEADLTIAGSGAAIPDSKMATATATLTAGKMALRVGVSSEMVEDSIVPVLPILQEQSMRAMMDAIDNVLLNGDTTNAATGNINLDDADPADTSKYLIFNGLRHLPIVTTTAQAVDAAGAPTVALMRSARGAMPARYNTRPRDLVWIVDDATHMKMLSMDEIATIDKYGPMATIMNGEVGKVDGVPVLVSAEMGLTEADGKISTTGGNNTKGQGVLVYRPGWVVGYRRRVNASMTFIPYYDAYQMVATVRLAFINFDAYVASALYDITV